MPHVIKVVATMTIALSQAPASAYDGTRSRGVWTQVRTVQGCLLYWEWHPSFETEAEFQRNSEFSFDGTGCQPNRVLTGQGKLTWHRMNLRGDPDQRHGYQGRVINGLLEGEVDYDWDGYSRQRMTFSGGCERNTQMEGACQPFSGSPTSYAAQDEGRSGDSGGSSTSGAGAPAGGSATPAAGANEDVFERCVSLHSLGRSGIQDMWELRNGCQSRISLSYCLKANFEAAGDYNLCSQREYRTHSVAAGGAIQFAFNLMPRGTALSDGRVVGENSELRVSGHACANGSSPGVGFEGGQFLFTGC